LGKENNIVYNNYRELIKHIIDMTDYKIALIPHVIQSFNDDLKVLTDLYNEFKDTNRILLIEDCNCMELKGYIARCKMFVGARTHSTIASYSSCVPTLAVGYSVKSKGIAKDIFGDYDKYVIPVESLKTNKDLTNGFIWLNNNYDKIKNYLEEFMPNYIKKSYRLGEVVNEVLRSKK